MERAAGVDRHHPRPVFVGYVFDIGESEDPGKIDRTLHRPEVANDGARDVGDRRRIGDVERIGGGDPPGADDRIDGSPCRSFVDIGNRHRIAGLAERDRGLAPDAAAAAGDQRDARHDRKLTDPGLRVKVSATPLGRMPRCARNP